MSGCNVQIRTSMESAVCLAYLLSFKRYAKHVECLSYFTVFEILCVCLKVWILLFFCWHMATCHYYLPLKFISRHSPVEHVLQAIREPFIKTLFSNIMTPTTIVMNWNKRNGLSSNFNHSSLVTPLFRTAVFWTNTHRVQRICGLFTEEVLTLSTLKSVNFGAIVVLLSNRKLFWQWETKIVLAEEWYKQTFNNIQVSKILS